MFYPFSFNVKYSLWKCWLETLLVWGEDWNLRVWLRHIQIRTEICLACPCSPTKVVGSFIVSSLMAGRLEYSSEWRHQAPPLEEKRLQTTDLSNNASDFFFHCVAGTYMSWAWPPLAAALSLCPPLVTQVNRGLWFPGASLKVHKCPGCENKVLTNGFRFLRAWDFFGVCLCRCTACAVLLMFISGVWVYHWLTSRIRTLKLIFRLKGMCNERK